MRNFVNILRKKGRHLGKIYVFAIFLLVLKCGNSAVCGSAQCGVRVRTVRCAGLHSAVCGCLLVNTSLFQMRLAFSELFGQIRGPFHETSIGSALLIDCSKGKRVSGKTLVKRWGLY